MKTGRGIEDNFKTIFSYFPMKTSVVTPSLEPSRQDDSNGGHQICSLWKIWIMI